MNNQLNATCVEEPRGDFFESPYTFNRAPLIANAMCKLPLGSVKASGWLAHQLNLMVDGMTGRLSEISPFLRPENGWLGGPEEGWEEQPYWLRGFYSLARSTGNRDRIAEAARWIEAILNSQDEDGYFGPPSLKCIVGKNGQKVCDLWPHMVMLDALIRHEEATSDPRVLALVVKFFEFCRDLPEDSFIPLVSDDFGNWKVKVQRVRAGDMLPHLYWAYNRTGHAWLLTLATRFYRRSSQPKDEWLRHHVINFIHQFKYPGSYYAQSGANWQLELCEYWYQQHLLTWGQQPRGIFGADEHISSGAVDPRQGFETCGFGEFAKSFYSLGQLTGNALYADRVEDILFNHFPASMTPDLKGLHYLTASNQPQLDNSSQHEYHNKYRQISYSPFEVYRCCQHNVAMTWPWFVENLWQASPDGGLVAWMYGGSTVCAKVRNGVTVTIEEITDYPFDGKVTMKLSPEATVSFPLYLRVPRWCEDMALCINGEAVDIKAVSGRYLRLSREWSSGDTVTIEMQMPEVSLKTWPRTGSVTVDRGPLSYSVKIEERYQCCGGMHEWPEIEIFPASKWNYGLLVDSSAELEPVQVEEMGVRDLQPWTIQGAPIEISMLAKQIPDWHLVNETVDVLRISPIQSDEPSTSVKFVPMGCARLRMSCLPVISESPDALPWLSAQAAVSKEEDK